MVLNLGRGLERSCPLASAVFGDPGVWQSCQSGKPLEMLVAVLGAGA